MNIFKKIGITLANIVKKAKIVGGGNIKLGASMGTWSKLKGNEPVYIERFGCSVCGSCGKYCSGCSKACYVNASYRYGSVIYGHAIRSLAVRFGIDLLRESLDKQLSRKRKPFDFIRINQSGEIESKKEFDMWVYLANRHPESQFYLYTKAYDIVVPYLLSNPIPANITVLISVWHESGIKEFNAVKHLPNVKAFVYLDGFDYEKCGIAATTKCNAYVGKKLNKEITCERCQKCMNRNENHKIIGCDAH